MFKAGELEAISMALEPQFRELEQRIMSDIVRRISINGEITRAADWQVTRLAQLGESKREIKKAIKDTLGLSTKEVNHLYKDVLRKGYERESELYKYKGRTQIPFAENHELQQLIGAVSKQTDGELKNITQSLGFAKRGADGKLEFTPVADYYQKTLDSAMLDISSGAFDYNTVLKRTVKEMTNSGLRSVDYATGHSNRVDVATRRALMTGMSQLTAKVNESNAEQLGTDMFETTAHGGARPEHQEWQGRWYTKDELESICGLGEVTGLCGANCYHDYYPVVPGISEPTYTAEQIEEFNRKENEPVEYNGKTYTKYEATQRQRKLEMTMRAQRQEIKLLKEGGASEDDLIAARSRYRGTSAEYARFSKAMDLPQQRERVTVDGLGNIGQGKYKADTPSETKQDAPQQTQDTQKGNSPVEQNDATQGVTEAVTTPDNVNNKSVDNRGESDIIEVRKNSIEDKLKEAKTTSDVSRITLEHFKEKGSKIQNIDFGSCDIDAAKAIAIKADDLDSRFESSCASIDVVHLSPDYAGMTTPDSVSFNNWISSKNLDRNELTSRIKLNQSYLSSKEVIINDFHDHHRSKYSNLAQNTWADEKNAFVTTFVHEYGHSILPGKANEIALQRGVINRDFMPFKRMYNTYMKELRDIEREISDIRTTYAGQTDGLRKGIEATKHLQAKYDSLCISHYSKESVGEFIAEAFCDAELSENPRTISLKVHETIEKLFGKKG